MSDPVIIFDYECQNSPLEEACQDLLSLSRKKQFSRVVTLNPQIFMGAERDYVMRKWVMGSARIYCDGKGLALAAKCCLGTAIQIVTGVDLVMALLKSGKRSFYFVGAAPAVIEKTVKHCQKQYPDARIKGWHHGFFSPFDAPEIVLDIVKKKPDFIFVGLGYPKQEYFLQLLQRHCVSGVGIGVGGVFDVLSGKKRLAPTWVRCLGFEWLFRGIQEPVRMLKWGFLGRFMMFVLGTMLAGRVRN